MSRTIAALYDSRAEAEFARARLVSRLKATLPRIIAKDTLGALEDLDIKSADKESYREKLEGGGHLLVAEAPTGASAQRIIELLEEAVGRVDRRADLQWGDAEKGVRVELPGEEPTQQSAGAAPKRADLTPQPLEPQGEAAKESQGDVDSEVPWFEQKLRKGKSGNSAGVARVRAFTHEAPAEERVTLIDETIALENRPSGRHLSDSEMNAGNLFKERVFEIAAMRELPVVTKVAVVREEVVVRKTLKERTETIRETVRQTQVAVEDVSASDEKGPAFFSRTTAEPHER